MRIGVLASGSGTNLEAILEDRIPVAVVVADRPCRALEIADFLFGGGALSSRLGNRVRQKEGLSYTVNSHLTVSPMDRAARFMMFAICNPATHPSLRR